MINDKQQKIRLVSITTAFPRNSTDVLIPWIIHMIRLLKEDNIETLIYTSSYKGKRNEVSDGIEVRRFRYFYRSFEKLSHDMSVPERLKSCRLYYLVLPFFILFGMLSAARYAMKESFDLIHVHFPFPLALFGIAMKLVKKKPMIYSCHGSDVNLAKKNFLFRYIFRFLLRRAECVVANSSYTEQIIKSIDHDISVKIIPMGNAVFGEPSLRKVRDDAKRQILFVGRLIEWKGVNNLINASSFLSKYIQEPFIINIVGDGPERESLEKLSQRLGASNIIFHGYKKGPELEEFYRTADVFVLPSIVDKMGFTEGLGTVLLEALRFGVPLIGTDVGGIPDIIKDKVTGILVPQKNPQAIALAISEILNDREKALALSKAAMEHAEKHFSWGVIASEYKKTYLRLLQNKT